VYDKHDGCLVGFVNLGSTNNKLMEFEAALSQATTSHPLATSMLVLLNGDQWCPLFHGMERNHPLKHGMERNHPLKHGMEHNIDVLKKND